MKKIEALIPAFHIDAVTDALWKEGVEDIVISEVLQSGPSQARAYRGVRYTVDYVSELTIEAVVADPLVAATANCIVEALQPGRADEVRISVTPVDTVLEIGGRATSAVAAPRRTFTRNGERSEPRAA
jgi:nitrogen regulatory protein PII